MSLGIRREQASAAAIAAHLRECGDAFLQLLQTRVDIDEYARKLHASASRFEFSVDERLVGLVAVYANDPQRRCAHISHVGVLPDWRGRGLGRRLLSACLQHLTDCGFERVELEVSRDNTGAQALYSGLGFTRLEPVLERVRMVRILKEQS